MSTIVNENYNLEERFYKFALRVIEIVNKLPKSTAGFEMGRQLFRAGTSIAANYAEAKGAFSKDDFIYKVSLAFKEARETHLWLRLIRDSKMLKSDMEIIIKEAQEIRNILGKSVKTAKEKSKKQEKRDK